MSTQAAQTLNPVPALIDELAGLYAEVKAFEPKQKRFDELRRLLADHANAADPAGDVRLEGNVGYVVFAKPAMTRTVPADKVETLYRILGKQGFLRCVKVAVGSVEKLLSPTEAASIFAVEPGPRRLRDAATTHSELFSDLRASLKVVR